MTQEVKHTAGPWGEHPYSTPEWQHVGAGENHGPFKAASLGIGAGRKLLGRVEAQTPIDGEFGFPQVESLEEMRANFALIIAAPELLAVLHEGRRAIGDHYAPNDCYATGPLTGDAIRDLVECPACSFIAKYDAAIARATAA